MKCPYCSSNNDRVVDKREINEGDTSRRRRECLKCGKRFTTYENIQNQELIVIKRSGKKEHFDIEKVRKGLEKAFEKRPFSEKDINQALVRIDKNIRKLNASRVRTTQIGSIVVDEIKAMDEVAYLRFISVYKNFKDVDSFKKELDKMKGD